MKRLCLLALVVASICSPVTAQRSRVVPTEYPTIAEALRAAQEGDTVLVRPGTYYENLYWPNVRGVTLRGTGTASGTVIDGGGRQVLAISNAGGRIDSTTVIERVHITHGGTVDKGGGIYVEGAPTLRSVIVSSSRAGEGGCLYVAGAAVLDDVRLTYCMATVRGGGGLLTGGSSVLRNSLVQSSSAPHGAGLAVVQSDATLSNVDVRNNRADVLGGGIYMVDTDASLSNVTVRANGADDGGGIYHEYGSGVHRVVLDRVIVSDNYAERYGGGLILREWRYSQADGTARLEFKALEVSRNVSGNSGGGIYVEGSGTMPVTIEDSRIVLNEAQGTNVPGAGGGGIYAATGILHVVNTTVAENRLSDPVAKARSAGAGVHVASGTLALQHVTVLGNHPVGIHVAAGAAEIRDSNVAANGWALYDAGGGQPSVASEDWWGSASGPYHPLQNPAGAGDSTGAAVDVLPFLERPHPDAPPVPIRGLAVASKTRFSVSLRWPASDLPDLAGYRLFWTMDPEDVGAYPYATDLLTDTTYTIDALQAGKTYYFTGVTVDVDGNESWYGAERVAVELTLPHVMLSTPSLEFGDVLIGTSKTLPLSITNAGTAVLEVLDVDHAVAAYTVSKTRGTVQVWDRMGLDVTFTPTAKGVAYDTLRIVSNAGAHPTLVPLRAVVRTGVDVEEDVAPAGFALEPNYPNPFNATTSISYSVSRPSHLRLTVANAAGRVVSVLVDEVKAPGTYTIPVDMAGLPGGVYFCRMEAGGFRATKTLVLLR